jgi:hypothetical protein
MEIIMEQIIKDAMRYRWLRDTNNLRSVFDAEGNLIDFNVGDVDTIMFWNDESSCTGETGKDFDDLVDKAMLFQKLNKENYDEPLRTA